MNNKYPIQTLQNAIQIQSKLQSIPQTSNIKSKHK